MTITKSAAALRQGDRIKLARPTFADGHLRTHAEVFRVVEGRRFVLTVQCEYGIWIDVRRDAAVEVL